VTPRIEKIVEKKLIGKKMYMSLAENKTSDLWKSFMPQRKEILHNVNNELISLQVYSLDYFANFKPVTTFEKWATVEVYNFEVVPSNMETFVLPEGIYAVFKYKGLSSNNAFFEYIFNTWMPSSDYELDHRPHFELLGEKYKNNDPQSEEEIWIPVQFKIK
jgi:AraC family transcriptional regulator